VENRYWKGCQSGLYIIDRRRPTRRASWEHRSSILTPLFERRPRSKPIDICLDVGDPRKTYSPRYAGIFACEAGSFAGGWKVWKELPPALLRVAQSPLWGECLGVGPVPMHTAVYSFTSLPTYLQGASEVCGTNKKDRRSAT
jgi:hypothetical protein